MTSKRSSSGPKIYEMIAENVKRINSGSPVGPKLHKKMKTYHDIRHRLPDRHKSATNWWTTSFTEDSGDSSQIVEISDSDDDEDFQCVITSGSDKDTTDARKDNASDQKSSMTTRLNRVQTLLQKIHSESKFEPKSDSKTVPKTDPKDMLRNVQKPGPKCSKKVEAMFEPKSRARVDPKLLMMIRSQTVPKTIAKTEPKCEPNILLKTNSNAVSKLDPKAARDIMMAIVKNSTVPQNSPNPYSLNVLIDSLKKDMKSEQKLRTTVCDVKIERPKVEVIASDGKCDNVLSGSDKKYECILCPHVSPTADAAKDHYLVHLEVYIECGECHEKFTNLQTYRKHNPKHLDRNKMLYLNEFMAAKKWCDNYVDYIERHHQLVDDLVDSHTMFCPICRTIKRCYPKSVTTSDKSNRNQNYKPFSEEFIRNHLHQHFQYLPYVCIDCDMEDKKTEFYLNATARQHLNKCHDIEKADHLSPNELMTYFDRKKSIKKLDHFIDNCVEMSLQMNACLEQRRYKCHKSSIFNGSKHIA